MIDDALLLGWLTRALEPGRALEVEEALAASPAVRARMSVLSAELRAREAPPPAWRIPPPGVPRGRDAPRPTLSLPAHLGDGDLRLGDVFVVRVPPPPGDVRVVLLRRAATGWQVVTPADPDDDVRLADLPADADGAQIHVMTGPEPGLQRWAVALPSASTPIDWEAPDRWAWLRDGIAAGDVPVVSVEIRVR